MNLDVILDGFRMILIITQVFEHAKIVVRGPTTLGDLFNIDNLIVMKSSIADFGDT